jgi:hypothetical protein
VGQVGQLQQLSGHIATSAASAYGPHKFLNVKFQLFKCLFPQWNYLVQMPKLLEEKNALPQKNV